MAPRMAIETPMPQKREVVNSPEATPRSERSTEPMMAEKLGVLKMASPRPSVASPAITCHAGEDTDSMANWNVPAAVTSIPSAESPRVPRRSESRPEIGVTMVITAGWTRSMRPGDLGRSSLYHYQEDGGEDSHPV